MSEALYNTGSLRFWNEGEIAAREAFTSRMAFVVQDTLTKVNPAWRFVRMEGPCLTPQNMISSAYDDKDIFITNHIAGASNLCLRAETTPSTYAYARWLMQSDKRMQLPLCVWQAGKSFRRELNDGASPSKLRFNEFHQLEFQCIYKTSTKADYREPLIEAARIEIKRYIGGADCSIVKSDRLPTYSILTEDIEAQDGEVFREMASISTRTDFAPDVHVLELAIGLDRIVSLWSRNYE